MTVLKWKIIHERAESARSNRSVLLVLDYASQGQVMSARTYTDVVCITGLTGTDIPRQTETVTPVTTAACQWGSWHVVVLTAGGTCAWSGPTKRWGWPWARSSCRTTSTTRAGWWPSRWSTALGSYTIQLTSRQSGSHWIVTFSPADETVGWIKNHWKGQKSVWPILAM